MPDMDKLPKTVHIIYSCS